MANAKYVSRRSLLKSKAFALNRLHFIRSRWQTILFLIPTIYIYEARIEGNKKYFVSWLGFSNSKTDLVKCINLFSTEVMTTVQVMLCAKEQICFQVFSFFFVVIFPFVLNCGHKILPKSSSSVTEFFLIN